MVLRVLKYLLRSFAGAMQMITYIIILSSILSQDQDNEQENVVHGNGSEIRQFTLTDIANQVVQIFIKRNDRVFLCSGFLLSRFHVVTAAHCINGSTDFLIRWQPDHPEESLLLAFGQVTYHPKWNNSRLIHDVALITLKTQQNCYFRTRIYRPRIEREEKGIAHLIGWMIENNTNKPTIAKTEVRIVSNKICRRYLGMKAIKKTHVCSLSNHAKNVCHGSSGGPLIKDNNLFGIISFGTEQCSPKYPIVSTRLSKYSDWLREHVK